MLRVGRRMVRSQADSQPVEVAELDGVRSLYLGSDTIQSSMRLSNPDALELAYARGMMMFLLFHAVPKDVLILGLGGGSIAKFIYHFLENCKTTVLEINPRVIDIARSHFYLPENDARLEVIAGDGIAYLRAQQTCCDVLMLDAYDSSGVAPDMVSQDFFDHCAAVLRPQGVLAVNLWGSDKNFQIYFERIKLSFGQRALMLRTGRPGNIIVLAFNQLPTELRWHALRDRAKALEQQFAIEFLQFTERLKDDNACSEHRLFLGAVD